MKIAVITGATSGMGREFALQLDAKIPNIEAFCLIGRRNERLQALAAMLTKPTHCLCLDLQDRASFAQYEAFLEGQSAEIVFLVNAAGYGSIGTVAQLSGELQLGMLDVNVTALTELTRLSMPYLAKKARIVNFASSAAFMPQPGFAVYAASKSYVLSFSRALNEELRGSGCTVTAVCPGPVKTEFFTRAEKDFAMGRYKNLLMSAPDKVVRKALTDAVLGRESSVYSWPMRAFEFLCKVLPLRFRFACMRVLTAL